MMALTGAAKIALVVVAALPLHYGLEHLQGRTAPWQELDRPSAVQSVQATPSAPPAGMPRFDPPAACKEVAAFSGNYSHTLFQGCMTLEQTSYDRLKDRWNTIPAGIKRQCVEVARFGGSPTYQILWGCIEMEISAARSGSQSFKF